MTGFAEVRSG